MSSKNQIIEALVASLEIPPSYYEKAYDRYNDLGGWFCREGGATRSYKPRIYPQGSFRLGTVVRPLNDKDSYDLDVGCRLETGVTKQTHTQEKLKTLVGEELEAYRQARQIQEKLDEKHRCWRLEYADALSFHLDVVPSIPEEMTKTASLADAMAKSGLPRPLADDVSRHSGNITDNRLPNYRLINPDWRISNSEGFARWFESRLVIATKVRENIVVMAKQASVEKLPAWKWKSPLQKAIQFLKRHRDSHFRGQPASKPISVILTTLAAKAYRGEEDTAAALDRILTDMDSYVLQNKPKVPNPVNPDEDFADKWDEPKYASLNLERNFHLWLRQARIDFQNIEKLVTEDDIQAFAEAKFGLRIPQQDILKILPLLPKSQKDYQSVHVITTPPPRPWCK